MVSGGEKDFLKIIIIIIIIIIFSDVRLNISIVSALWMITGKFEDNFNMDAFIFCLTVYSTVIWYYSRFFWSTVNSRDL